MNCVIIHGCPSYKEPGVKRTYDKHWIPWTKKELSAKAIKVDTPTMPEPWSPDYEKFKKEFEKYEVNSDTVLIGHSCGCAFLVRWLGESKKNVRKLILVAPWKVAPASDEARKKFYNYPINPSVKKQVKEIVMFTADNEEAPGKESLKLYQQVLGGKLIELEGRGHYTLGDTKTEKFPELIKEILS